MVPYGAFIKQYFPTMNFMLSFNQALVFIFLVLNEKIMQIPLKWTVMDDTGKEIVQKSIKIENFVQNIASC